MDIGVLIFPTDQTIEPIELAHEADARGFESLWFPEHSHIPTSRVTPWGGAEGAPPLPEFYWRTHDPFVSLAACAAVTTDIKVATGICLVAQRDPIHTAKEVASLDRISNGRFLFGVGYGWNKEEMAHHGTAYTERRDMLRENILAMKQLWTEDEASFAGDHVQFSSSWAWPKPTQDGGPPVIMGGNAGPRPRRTSPSSATDGCRSVDAIHSRSGRPSSTHVRPSDVIPRRWSGACSEHRRRRRSSPGWPKPGSPEPCSASRRDLATRCWRHSTSTHHSSPRWPTPDVTRIVPPPAWHAPHRACVTCGARGLAPATLPRSAP